MRVWLRRLSVLTSKEFIQAARDPILMFFVAWVFVADVYLAGAGVALDLRHTPMAVRDEDQSHASRELISRFREPHFRIVGSVSDPDRAAALLDEGRISAVLEVPHGFGESIASGTPASVQFLVDTTNPVVGTLGSSYAAQIAARFASESVSTEGLSIVVENRRILYNANQRNEWFMGITELLNVITILAIMLPASVMVREKERGTIEQLLVSPLSPMQILLPKVLAMALVILAGTTLTLGLILRPLFHVPFRGSLLLFFAVTASYVATTCGVGLLIATFSRNIAQVGMIGSLILAPMIFLSGVFTPPEAMPRWMQLQLVLSPLHYYVDTGLGILLKGSGPATIAAPVATMLGIGTAIFTIGLWQFRRQFE